MKKILYWIFAVLLTLSAVVYQRYTGPTKPKRVVFELNGNEYKTSFPRSLETSLTTDSFNYSLDEFINKGYVIDNSFSKINFKLNPVNDSLNIKVYARAYPSGVSLVVLETTRDSSGYYHFLIPSQPPAGKMIYYPVFQEGNSYINPTEHYGIIVRFKSQVPAGILIPHILFMFLAMFISNYILISSLLSNNDLLKKGIIVVAFITIGGLVLGPFVQKYAFGQYWTGWPFGEDLTDNKTLFAFFIWVTALYFYYKNRTKRWILLIASIIMLLIYSIPHSTAGSEFDHSKGEVITGRK